MNNSQTMALVLNPKTEPGVDNVCYLKRRISRRSFLAISRFLLISISL